MTLIVENPVVIDRHFASGDPVWDGDQTLWEVEVSDETGDNDALLFVVARGDGYIGGEIVRERVERLAPSVQDLRAMSHSPGPRRRPHITLLIEPGKRATT